MPFRTFRRSKRRFSATPRRRSFRRTQTTMPRMQQAQFSFVTEHITNWGIASDQQPDFTFIDMLNWDAAPPGGYDQKWNIKGIMFEMFLYPESGDFPGTTPGEFVGMAPLVGPALWAVAMGGLFVDEVVPGTLGGSVDGTPQSLVRSAAGGLEPYGPFVTLPPVADPSSVAVKDQDVLPTRYMLRKYSQFQLGFQNVPPIVGLPDVLSQGENYVIGNSAFRWSARLRKRITVGSKQGLFLGLFSYPAFRTVDVDAFAIHDLHISGTLYYTLSR